MTDRCGKVNAEVALPFIWESGAASVCPEAVIRRKKSIE